VHPREGAAAAEDRFFLIAARISHDCAGTKLRGRDSSNNPRFPGWTWCKDAASAGSLCTLLRSNIRRECAGPHLPGGLSVVLKVTAANAIATCKSIFVLCSDCGARQTGWRHFEILVVY
jgi:hypothetical protein